MGCFLEIDGLTCIPTSSVGGNSSLANLNFNVQYVSPSVATNSLQFSVQVWLLNQLRNSPPIFSYIFIQGGIPGWDVASTFVPGPCNNIQYYNASQPPAVFVPVNDPVGLLNYFNNFVNTNHTFSFNPANLTFGMVLYALLGNINVRNATNVLDRSVSIDPTGTWVQHQLSMDLNDIVSNCPNAAEVFTPTARYYYIPIAVAQRSYMGYDQIFTNFYITVSTAGVVQSVSSSSQFTLTLYRSELTSMISTCPQGQVLLQTVYLFMVGNVFVPGFVGPRTASDILWTSPTVGNSLQNCYGEYVYALQKLSCTNNICATQVTTRTRCRPFTVGGDEFSNCSYALQSDMISDVGIGNSYSSALDGQHTMWTWTYLCPNASSNINCTLAINTPNTPDQWNSNITIFLYEGTDITVNFDVYAGLLPYPTAPLSSIETLSQGPNSVVSVTDLYQSSLTWNGVFTFVIGILNPQLQQTCNLTMDIGTLFRIDPLDIYGNVIPGLNSLYISMLFPFMTYVPKQMLQYCPTTCQNTPATANQTAYDSFSIPVITLRALLPANGYAVSVAWIMSVPSASTAHNLQSTGLHLMDSSSESIMEAQDHLQAIHNRSTSKQRLQSHNYNSNRRTTIQEEHLVAPSRKLLQSTTSPPSAAGTGGQVGTYYFEFIINDATNPNPPQPVNITVNQTVNGTNVLKIVQGMQLVMHFYLTSTAPVPATANLTVMETYLASQLPGILAATLSINVNQVIDMTASPTLPLNTLSQPKDPSAHLMSTMERPHRKSLQSAQLGVLQPPLYATWVIIPNPNITSITAQMLTNELLSQPYQALFQELLLAAGLLLDTAFLPLSVQVFVPPTNWYLNVQTVTQPTTAPTAFCDSNSSEMECWNPLFGLLGLIIFIFLIFGVCKLSGCCDADSTQSRWTFRSAYAPVATK
jgi:hypothetical protein